MFVCLFSSRFFFFFFSRPAPRATREKHSHQKNFSPWFFSKISKTLSGLLNIQYCVQDEDVYIIEANPRASRTVPFVAKAVGHPLAAYASLLMSGMTLKEIGFEKEPVLRHVAVKEAVLPFEKFAGADTLLGPEMKSTGEVRDGRGGREGEKRKETKFFSFNLN